MGSSRDIVQDQNASGKSIPFHYNHNLPVTVRRNIALWGSFPKWCIKKSIIVARVEKLFGDSYIRDAHGNVTLLTQHKAHNRLMQMFQDKLIIHLRKVEMEVLAEVGERVFPQESHQVKPDVYIQYDNYHGVVESDGFERKYLDRCGKFMVYLIILFVSLCYQYKTFL